ncbi:hypothetical protein [Geobacter sp.]|uniref:hypothetical protein n=1 Tax=Geobacter sp. TaxID=46610 RepID=UPI00262CCDD5|nr:hypothetical protein [Geobacter sp.]
MKKMHMLLIMAVMVMSGCADSSALIRTSRTSIRTDIFQELSNGGPVPAGYADLLVTSSLKTHMPGIYSVKDIHGTPDYKLLLNIDGQAVQLRGSLREENIEPRGLRDPEAGEGIRYMFGKKLRLKAGMHRIVIASITDEIAIEREITLADGSVNSLVLEPLYGTTSGKRRPAFYGVTSFSEGIKGFRVVLNGKPV